MSKCGNEQMWKWGECGNVGNVGMWGIGGMYYIPIYVYILK